MITTSSIYKNTKRLNSEPSVLDVAMECADFLEQTGAFAYKNWEDGELVAGPFINKYYVEVTFMYPHKKTPDPDYILRLENIDCKVSMIKDEYKRVYYERNPDVKFGDAMMEKKVSSHNVWLITIKIPERFLALDGNTIFNIDGQDVYYDDLEVTYDDEVKSESAGSDDEDLSEDDFGDFDL